MMKTEIIIKPMVIGNALDQHMERRETKRKLTKLLSQILIGEIEWIFCLSSSSNDFRAQ